MITTSRARFLVSTGMAAGLLFCWAGPATAADPTEPRVTTDGASTTIKVHSVVAAGASAEPMGQPKPGDTFTFTDNLTQVGTLVGTDKGVCTVEATTFRCEVTYYFPRGTLVAKGEASSDNFAKGIPFGVPIVSGTGAYSGATGKVLVDPNPDDSTDDTLTFTTSAGQVEAVPSGGADTGGGSTSTSDSALLLGLGAAVMLAGAGLFGAARRGARRT